MSCLLNTTVIRWLITKFKPNKILPSSYQYKFLRNNILRGKNKEM